MHSFCLSFLIWACNTARQPFGNNSSLVERPSEHIPIASPPEAVFFIAEEALQLKSVWRSVETPERALLVLYEGPTEEEAERGIGFLSCGSTGAKLISLEKGLAIVQLEGSCGGCGALGIYDSILATLKQFSTISYVHVLDPQGKTQKVSLTQDARPGCLEP